MELSALIERIDGILERLGRAGWKERDEIKQELLAVAREAGPHEKSVREHLEWKRKDLALEARWEVDEVLEATAPAPPAPEEPEEPEVEEPEEPEDPSKPLSAADLVMVYDDPRGLVLHKTKKGERWFATQVNPQTGQPQTFELHPQEVQQVKQQLAGSPYWVIGSGEAPGA